jgi:hypothetical protein
MVAHVLASLALDAEECAVIDAWCLDMETRVGSVTYCAVPAWFEPVEPVTDRTLGWRGSCAGFVRVAYESVGLSLVRDEDLPVVSYNVVRETWRNL